MISKCLECGEPIDVTLGLLEIDLTCPSCGANVPIPSIAPDIETESRKAADPDPDPEVRESGEQEEKATGREIGPYRLLEKIGEGGDGNGLQG